MLHRRVDLIVAALALLLPCVVFSRAASGQEVSGFVRDATTSAPVRGAVVALLGANRESLARTITSSSGAFRLRYDGGAVVLRVIRIGYTPLEQRLAAAPSSPLAIDLIPLGRTLRPISVSTRPVCPARRDQAEALALWSSATDAMLAMTVASTEASQSGAVNQLLFNRLMGTDGRSIARQSTRRVVTENASPIRADRDPEEFVDTGYVVRRADASTYYGPDPEILLDSSFAATHCLSITVDGGAHPEEVGVAFTPTRDRASIPDIAGVLWLTRSPMALRSLTFEYRGVDPAIIAIRAGGRLDFETMSSGVPVIRSWHVRSPKVGYLRGGYVSGRFDRNAERARVVEIHETGGLITGGRLTDGTILTAPLATLGGRVLQARTGDPVAGARVTIDSTDQVAVTDRSGQFSFEDVLSGPYVLRARDSVVIFSVRVDSAQNIVPDTGVQQIVTRTATMAVEARIGHVAPVDLRLPWRDRVGGCSGALDVERRFVVLGVVVTPGGDPVPSARVRLSWADTTRSTTIETSVDAEADVGGGFLMCGIPAGIPLAARVVRLSGAVSIGTAKVNLEEQGRRRDSPLRAIKIVVAQPDSARAPKP